MPSFARIFCSSIPVDSSSFVVLCHLLVDDMLRFWGYLGGLATTWSARDSPGFLVPFQKLVDSHFAGFVFLLGQLEGDSRITLPQPAIKEDLQLHIV